MPIVERPNKEALLKAVDIFLDRMRPFFIECLHYAPGATAQIALERSLRGDQGKNFSRNLHFGKDLESAIDVSFFATLAETYWEDIFSSRFGGDRKVLRRLRKVTEARNRASHPPHLGDLDDEFTQGSLCHIAFLLGSIRAWEERSAVLRLRDGLGEPFEAVLITETVVRRMVREVQEADAARIAAEETALLAEATRIEAQEQKQAAEISRVLFEKRACAAESARQKAEEVAERREFARKEAERRALAAEAAQLEGEKRLQTAVERMLALEQRLKKTEALLGDVQKRESDTEATAQTTRNDNRPIQNGRPVARNSPQYEVWLIGEILSGNISRSRLGQYAGDNRIDGRLVHYVQAASSEMSHQAWTNYVASRNRMLVQSRHAGGSHEGHSALLVVTE